ncbi:MAG: hypothetical protein WDW38_005380 [Sanguina aurantia]
MDASRAAQQLHYQQQQQPGCCAVPADSHCASELVAQHVQWFDQGLEFCTERVEDLEKEATATFGHIPGDWLAELQQHLEQQTDASGQQQHSGQQQQHSEQQQQQGCEDKEPWLQEMCLQYLVQASAEPCNQQQQQQQQQQKQQQPAAFNVKVQQKPRVWVLDLSVPIPTHSPTSAVAIPAPRPQLSNSLPADSLRRKRDAGVSGDADGAVADGPQGIKQQRVDPGDCRKPRKAPQPIPLPPSSQPAKSAPEQRAVTVVGPADAQTRPPNLHCHARRCGGVLGSYIWPTLLLAVGFAG